MKKNENKKQNKVLKVAALALLLGIVGYTGGTTFAKYVSTQNVATESATVAKWGLTATADVTNLFGTEYNNVQDKLASVKSGTNGLVVKAATSTGNIVAPGTKGSMTVTFAGQAEVDAVVTFDANLVDISLDTYYPVKWTVTHNGAVVTDVDTAAEINDYFNNLEIEYNAGATALNDVFVISWAWAFEGQDDAKDTLLGQGQGNQEMVVDLTVTFTQVQDETK